MRQLSFMTIQEAVPISKKYLDALNHIVMENIRMKPRVRNHGKNNREIIKRLYDEFRFEISRLDTNWFHVFNLVDRMFGVDMCRQDVMECEGMTPRSAVMRVREQIMRNCQLVYAQRNHMNPEDVT